MTQSAVVGKLVFALIAMVSVGACYVEPAGPDVECRTVEVRRKGDVELCKTRCGDEGCRTRCAEKERWAREHRCWVE